MTTQDGETAFEHVFGLGIFQYEAPHPEHTKIFDEAMAKLIGVYNAGSQLDWLHRRFHRRAPRITRAVGCLVQADVGIDWPVYFGKL
jgi:hypothetical protein